MVRVLEFEMTLGWISDKAFTVTIFSISCVGSGRFYA